jgi:hypothetical protein
MIENAFWRKNYTFLPTVWGVLGTFVHGFHQVETDLPGRAGDWGADVPGRPVDT